MDQRHGVLALIMIIAGVFSLFSANSVVAQGLRGGGGAAPAQSTPSGPVQVGVVTLQHQSVPVTVELPGRVSASQSADVRPQVGGVIKSIDFKAGQQVQQGDVLFEIDSATYDAQVAVAQAAVQKAQAAETNAQTKLTRSTQLAQTNNLSQSDLQDAQLAETQAQADVASANASLDAAKINASLTKVVAPISGLISDSAVTTGALVTAAQSTALATIRQLDPSYVDLVETSANLLKLRAQLQNGTVKGNGRTPGSTSVHLTLEDGTTYDQVGTLTVADFVVSESTGTFGLRATFANPRRLLLPGMFVRATVDLGTEPNGFLVPQRAVTFDASGQATAFFVENGKAVSHVLTTSGTSGNNWVVTAGVADGAQLIVDGVQKISNGSAVTPLPVTLDDQGVAVDAGSSAASSVSSAAGNDSAPPIAPVAEAAPGSTSPSSVVPAPTPAVSAAPSSPAPVPSSPSLASAPAGGAPPSSAAASTP